MELATSFHRIDSHGLFCRRSKVLGSTSALEKSGKSGKDRVSLREALYWLIYCLIRRFSPLFSPDFFETQLSSFVINIPAWFLLSFPII
jgi:hypothetical protein